MKKMIVVLVQIFMIIVMTGCANNPSAAVSEPSARGTVLVAGATGRTGRLIVEALLAKGFKVRAFVRNEDKAKKLFADQVELAIGDVRDKASVNQAMKGVESVFSAIGAGGSKDPTNLPEDVDYGGTKNLANAAVAENVQRFIMVSSRSAGTVDHFLNKRHHNVLIWKFKGENVLRDSELNYTIVRPGGLIDDPGGKHKIVAFQPSRKDIRLRRITRADVANVCVESLFRKIAFRKTFAVVNDPDEKPQSMDRLFQQI